MPDAPLASRYTVSLVEVSVSTLMRLKLAAAAARRASRSTGAATAASVVTKPSMVAIDGAIMPLPLAMPPRVTVRLPAVNVRTADLAIRSVVRMA